ncbi:MAG TPA: inositol monophosphatase family protein, partial [Tepidisphaeraceae bacterium]|nr:inositol monophosphatase family protein [Tepidisphaeraceae bacterium]
MASDLAADLAFAVDLARGAGQVVARFYGHVERLTKTNSASTDEAVTEADRATQRFIVQGLRGRYPGDGLVGEESDTGEAITFECRDPMGRNWVIDPIDGTNNFIAGLGAFGVCIGLLDKGEPVLGVVYDVTRDAMYAAARGHGAWLEEPRRLGGRHPIKAPTDPLSPSSMVMLTSNLIDKAGRCPQWACHFLGQTTWKTRILGSAAIEAVQVAAGVAHAAFTVNGKLWD